MLAIYPLHRFDLPFKDSNWKRPNVGTQPLVHVIVRRFQIEVLQFPYCKLNLDCRYQRPKTIVL